MTQQRIRISLHYQNIQRLQRVSGTQTPGRSHSERTDTLHRQHLSCEDTYDEFRPEERHEHSEEVYGDADGYGTAEEGGGFGGGGVAAEEATGETSSSVGPDYAEEGDYDAGSGEDGSASCGQGTRVVADATGEEECDGADGREYYLGPPGEEAGAAKGEGGAFYGWVDCRYWDDVAIAFFGFVIFRVF